MSQEITKYGYSEVEHLPEDLYTSQSSVKTVLGEGKSLCIVKNGATEIFTVPGEPVITEDAEAIVVEDEEPVDFECGNALGGVPAYRCASECEVCKEARLDSKPKESKSKNLLINGHQGPIDTSGSEKKDKPGAEA